MDAENRAKNRIKREKSLDKAKHDRMMDRARMRDTMKKNRETVPEGTDFAAHRAAQANKPKLTDSDRQKMTAVAAMLKRERDRRAAMKKEESDLDERACWSTHKKVGMKKKGNRMVPNCVPKNEEVEQVDEISAKTAKSAWLKRKSQAAKVSGHNHDILAAKARQNKERFGRKEEMPEERTPQDSDIKDRKGSQPAAYHKGLKKATKEKRDAHFKKHGPKADNDRSAYKDAPGDKAARKKGMPKSKHTKFVDNMMKEEDNSFAAKSKKSGISVGTLRKVYNRGVAAWKTGHRPGTTPQQWGHARVNAFIAKKKKGGLNHDKDLA